MTANDIKTPAISDGGLTLIIILRRSHGRVVDNAKQPPHADQKANPCDDRKRVSHYSTAMDGRSSLGADLSASCAVVFFRFFSSFITWLCFTTMGQSGLVLFQSAMR